MRTTARGAWLTAVLAAATIGCASSPHRAAPAPTSSRVETTSTAITSSSATSIPTSASPLPDLTSSVDVSVRHLALLDPTRPTVTSSGTYVAPTRSLPTTVWVPGGSGPFPLVVFAHGFRDGVGPYVRFASNLAAHGFVVAAPSFPLTDQTRAGPNLDEADLDHEAADLSFVLTNVLADPGLADVIDRTRIGAVGHSDGASVVVQLAYGPTGADPRVQAIVALTGGSPGAGVLDGPPMLLEQSDTDQYNDLSTARDLLEQVNAPWWFLELHGATHAGPVEGDSTYTPLLDDTVVAFLDRFVARTTADDTTFESIAESQPTLATLTSG